jgi:hypothetical protein
MPSYTFDNFFPAVFGDLHIGVNALVEGKDFADGSAVMLESGDVVVTDKPYDHPFLTEKSESKTAKVGKPSKDEAPVEATFEATDSDSSN